MKLPGYSTSDVDDSRSSSPSMVESNSSLNGGADISTSNITAIMLLGREHSDYFGRVIDRNSSSQESSPVQQHHHIQHHQQQHQENHHPNSMSSARNTTSSLPTSLFTIDSILAPNSRRSESPENSPEHKSITNTMPIRPTRVPTTMLHHPGLHLGHLAAAAGFGNPTSDFLGIYLFIESILSLYYFIHYYYYNISQ